MLPPSKFVNILAEAVENYKQVWLNKDESNNFTQKYDAELVKQVLRPEVEKEIRLSVDQLLRVELDNLRLNVEGRKRGKGKKNSGTKTKKKKVR